MSSVNWAGTHLEFGRNDKGVGTCLTIQKGSRGRGDQKS